MFRSCISINNVEYLINIFPAGHTQCVEKCFACIQLVTDCTVAKTNKEVSSVYMEYMFVSTGICPIFIRNSFPPTCLALLSLVSVDIVDRLIAT